MSPLHGLQFSVNCSSRVPFHRVQSFRNSWGPPWVSQILPPNLHQSGFLSPQVTGPARSLLLQRHLPLMGLALVSGRSLLGQSGTGSIRHSRSFWQLLTEPQQHPHTPRYQNLATQTSCRQSCHPAIPNDIYPSPDQQELLLMCNGKHSEEGVIYLIIFEPVVSV